MICDQESYSQLDLDDLHEPEAMDGIVLQMQDRQRYFSAVMSKGAEEAVKQVKHSMSAFAVMLNFLIVGSCCHFGRHKSQAAEDR